jgi:hypothetical protein
MREFAAMVVSFEFRGAWVACAALAWLPTWAQQAPAVGVPSGPTRMQRCQTEMAGVEGPTRTRKLRECLIGRAEGERLIARDCTRQFRSLPAGHGADKVAFQKQCVAAGLQVSHDKLPRRKPPAPRVEAVVPGDKPVTQQSLASPSAASQ